MLASLGLFVFELTSAPYEKLEHASRERYASNNRLGRLPALQHLGPGEDTITLSGTLYPEITGGIPSLNMLQHMKTQGEAFVFMTGSGRVYGHYVIEGIRETQSYFYPNGEPRKIEFNLSLRATEVNPQEQASLSYYVEQLRNQGARLT